MAVSSSMFGMLSCFWRERLYTLLICALFARTWHLRRDPEQELLFDFFELSLVAQFVVFCRSNMANVRQSRPHSGREFQETVVSKPCEFIPLGSEALYLCGLAEAELLLDFFEVLRVARDVGR